MSTSTLSSCSHAVVALLYPFSWQHTFIPVLPASMIDIVCCPTPFLVGLLSSSLPKLKELPVEEVSQLGNPVGGKGDGKKGGKEQKPPGGKGRGEWRGGRHWDLPICDLCTFLPSSYPFSLGGQFPAGGVSVICRWEYRVMEVWGGHCRDSHPEFTATNDFFSPQALMVNLGSDRFIRQVRVGHHRIWPALGWVLVP